LKAGRFQRREGGNNGKNRGRKTPAIQVGRPDSVHLKLIGDDGVVKALVSVYPKYEKLPFTDTFLVEIIKGGPVSPEVDIRLNL